MTLGMGLRERFETCFADRPAARAVALFYGLNLFMVALYTALFRLAVLKQTLSGQAPSVLALLTHAVLPWLLALGLYLTTLLFLRPGTRSPLELALLGALGVATTALLSFSLYMPVFSLALVPIVARYWLKLNPTVVLSALLLVWSVVYYAFWSPEGLVAALIVSLASLLFGGYALLNFEFALLHVRAQDELKVLYTELEASYRLLRGYRELELQHAQLEERSRISRELHDTLGHHLSAQRFDLQALQKLVRDSQPAEVLSRAFDRNTESLSDLRRAVQALRPEPLEALGLEAGLRQLISLAPDPERISLVVTGLAGTLRPEVALTLYRIGQETLTNAAKHAAAEALELSLDFGAEQVEIRAQNQMSSANGEAFRFGFGLQGLRARTAALGGRLEVEAQRGTFQLWATVPR